MTTIGLGIIFAWPGTIGVNGIAITKFYGIPISENQYSWICSTGSLGAASTFLSNQKLATKFGRKKATLGTTVAYVAGWLLIIFPISGWSFVIGRLFHGICYGMYSYLVPLYITEIGEKTIRGRLSSFYEFSLVLGYLCCYSLALLVDLQTASILCCLIIFVHVAVFSFMPESPVHWLQRDNVEAARESLTRLRGVNYNNIDKELQELRDYVVDSSRRANVSFFAALSSSRAAKKALLVSCGIMALQQLTGIAVVLTYSIAILNNNFNTGNTILSLLIITVLRLIASCLTGFFIDNFGRRITLLISIIPLAATSYVLAIYEQLEFLDANLDQVQWLPTVAVAIYLASFTFAFSSFPQFVSTEFLPANIKDVAYSASMTVGYLFAFFILNVYGHLNNVYWAFYVFGVFNTITSVFVYKFLPETRKKTLAAIQQELYSSDKK